MSQTIQAALENVKDIFMSDSSLATLLNYERVISELDVYAFKNWKLGELVKGPEYEKYFVTCTWMFPYSKMPDPRGGEQLLNYNCSVTYQKEQLEYPIKPKSQKDFRPNSKLAKTKKVPIWLVTITMPKDLMADIQRGSMEVENEKLDIEDIDQAYETGQDDSEMNNQDQGSMDQGDMDQGGMNTGMGGPANGQQQPPM